MSIDQMRKNYTLSGLCESQLNPDPIVQFRRSLDEAMKGDVPDWFEANAATLATSSKTGDVTSRIILIKGIEDVGRFHFFTNYESEKGRQLAANPVASLCIFWPHLQRQIRLRGSVSKLSREQSQTYFHSRPVASQLGALVSRQSDAVSSRQDLEQRMCELSQQYEGQVVPCPEHWGGYALQAERIEFWQGRQSRLHDRLVYSKSQSGSWSIGRISP